MINTLFTYGCSFTQDFQIHINKFLYGEVKPPQRLYLENFLNGEIPLGWTEMLSNKLNMINNNYAIGGGSNNLIFQSFCDSSHLINENDIVIMCWTNKERYNLVNKITNSFVVQYPNLYQENIISRKTHDEILYNRIDHKWYDELKSFEKLIENYGKSKKFKVFFWTIDEKLKDEKYILNEYYDKDKSILVDHGLFGKYTINAITNGIINDSHLSKEGHEYLFELFYKHIINYL